jgi:uncharacterized protein YqgV (UPF0045/DUF77 family)
MTATIEISFYPLQDNYPDVVISFLEKLKTLTQAELQTNGMSTILIGPFDTLWNQLGLLIKNEFSSHASLFVMKVAAGRREFENISV